MDDSPFAEGTRLQLIDNPGTRGRATGRTRTAGTFLMVELELGPNDRRYYRHTQLEEYSEIESLDEQFAKRAFGRPEDLRRILALSRMDGNLTNVLYSMESANTEFLAHQYKPVLKFIESPVGRLLIADEVGLGKTIEAVYIWQELQARSDARRLLILCPSMLREKWQYDLKTRFDIDDALLIDAKSLLETLESVADGGKRRSFVYIASLESLRTREEDADPYSMIARERLAGFLKENEEGEGDPLLDLVIIDEAHYLRNASTASHQIAAMLRDVSRNLLLLSATPLQTSEENLFNLLKLLSPENFTDSLTFLSLYAANAIIVRAANSVLYGKDPSEARTRIEEALSDEHFRGNPALMRAIAAYSPDRQPCLEERIEIGRSIEALSLFGTYFTRSRKRDVFVNRVVRTPEKVMVELDDYELGVYESVTRQIRDRSKRSDMIDMFLLISRQRQLTSSIFAALRKWTSQDRVVDDETWEDLGALEPENHSGSKKRDSIELDLDFDLERLRAGDSKYRGFLNAIRDILRSNQREKIVVFTYYRATIAYLVERLHQDGITAMALTGGMGDERWTTIGRFRDDSAINILVSSEVGSEGIDLQFCRYLFNYDLPWNPMRLEQRIGRLDRIGQKAEKIMIYNLYCPNTVEDRVVMRLYERIEIFRNSIGDLEDILGEYIEEVSNIIINPDLTPEERESRLLASEAALIEERMRNAMLEEESIELVGHGERVLQSIERTHGLRRWVGPDDTLGMVRDFFSLRYPQTQFRDGKPDSSLVIELSSEARVSLGKFIERTRPARVTALASSEKPVLCLFDLHIEAPTPGARYERITTTHPLIRWIISEYETDRRGLYPLSAISVSQNGMPCKIGVYVYMIQQWSVQGIKSRIEQRFFMSGIGSSTLIEGEDAELVLGKAAVDGMPWHDWNNEVDPTTLDTARDELLGLAGQRFEGFVDSFTAENKSLCDRQEQYVTLSVSRRRDGIRELIGKLADQGKTKVIPMHEGRVKNLDKELDRKLEKIRIERNVDTDLVDLSMGVIKII